MTAYVHVLLVSDHRDRQAQFQNVTQATGEVTVIWWFAGRVPLTSRSVRSRAQRMSSTKNRWIAVVNDQGRHR
jgi:hypothetical protein